MPISVKRRKFLQTSTLATLGVATSKWTFAMSPFGNFQMLNVPSDRALTPVFLAEDLLRLVQLSDFEKRIKQALTVNHNYFQMGKVWGIQPDELIKLAKKSRSLWDSEQEQDQAQIQLALVTGWVAHQIIKKYVPDDRGGKPLDALSGKVLYQDTYLIKMLQNADPHRIKLVPDQPLVGVEPEAVAELLHVIQQRNLIRMHTTRPEFSDVQTWLDNFLDYYDRLKADNLQYAQVYCLPEAKKIEQYITMPAFYDESDALIQTARNFQMGVVNAPSEINKTLQNPTNPRSIYGKALENALEKIRVCSNFVTGQCSENELRQAFER